MTKAHTNTAFDNELRAIQDRILLIASRVEKMLVNSIKSLAENNTTLARETIAQDKYIDKDEMFIDRLCIELLARRQPLGEDLRFVVSVIKMVTYFERLGDLAVKICHKVIKLNNQQKNYTIDGIDIMSKGVQNMIKDMVEAFILRDYKKAMLVIHKDDEIDEIYHTTTRQFIKEMAESQHAENYYHLISIAKWLERMGDHCTNLAELIIFMIKGEDIRHKEIEKTLVTSL